MHFSATMPTMALFVTQRLNAGAWFMLRSSSSMGAALQEAQTDLYTAQVIEESEQLWRKEERFKALLPRVDFATGDFFTPGAALTRAHAGRARWRERRSSQGLPAPLCCCAATPAVNQGITLPVSRRLHNGKGSGRNRASPQVVACAGIF